MKATALCLSPLGGSILGIISFMITHSQFEKEDRSIFWGFLLLTYIIALMVLLAIELAFLLLKFCIPFRLKEYLFVGCYCTVGVMLLGQKKTFLDELGLFFIMYTLGNILTYYFLYFRHFPEIKETDERK